MSTHYVLSRKLKKKKIMAEIKYCVIVLLFFFLLFYSVLRPFQDYFSSYETGQSVGGAKTGEPREKPPDTPASRTWLVSHVARAGLEPTPDTGVIVLMILTYIT